MRFGPSRRCLGQIERILLFPKDDSITFIRLPLNSLNFPNFSVLSRSCSTKTRREIPLSQRNHRSLTCPGYIPRRPVRLVPISCIISSKAQKFPWESKRFCLRFLSRSGYWHPSAHLSMSFGRMTQTSIRCSRSLRTFV